MATRSDMESRYGEQRDLAAKGPVGRESLALPRMEPEARPEPPPAPASPG